MTTGPSLEHAPGRRSPAGHRPDVARESTAGAEPAHHPAQHLLRLQAAGGNAMVVQLLRGGGSDPGPQGRASPPGGALALARQPDDAPVAPGPSVPARYAGLVTPSLSQADARMLQQVTGGADLVDMIKQRDATRLTMEEIAVGVDSGALPEGGAVNDYDRLQDSERGLTAQIDAQLAALGVGSEADLLNLVADRFPTRFLAEARQVALDMLGHNEGEAREELARYSGQVCSPDVEGLLAADRALAELDPTPTELSVRTARQALSVYGPIAGVVSNEELAAMIPSNQRSVMVDITNLARNEQRLPQQRELYHNARYAHGRRYPILLSSGYRPGTFAHAPPEELGKLVAAPVTEMLDNIERVRDAINDDELKVWNMRDVLRITQERLGVHHPVLVSAIETRVAEVESDEAFMGWVMAALAITTSVVAGVLFTPAAGAAVAAAWGAYGLAGSIDTYLNESAAENIAFDPAVADLSLNEPTLTWVLLDAMLLGLDLAPVARALRPAARTLSQSPNPVALQVFREQAAARLGPDAAEQLAHRAAARFGIQTAGQELAEDLLSQARTVLADLHLSDDAIARILAKAPHTAHIKGQLFEEVMHADVAHRLAQGSSDVLGVGQDVGLETIAGHRITDLHGQQLTDGLIARRLPDGSLRVLTVLEAKAGSAAAAGLRSGAKGIGDPGEYARVVIEASRDDVVKALRRAGLDADAAAVAAGGQTLSDAAIDVVAADKKLRRLVTQAELGGQVRSDAERLAAGTGPDLDDISSLDAVPAQILVDGVPTTVHFSPTGTRFVGAVPPDVRTDAIARSLQELGYSFEALSVGPRAAELAARAERLAALTAPAQAAAP